MIRFGLVIVFLILMNTDATQAAKNNNLSPTQAVAGEFVVKLKPGLLKQDVLKSNQVVQSVLDRIVRGISQKSGVKVKLQHRLMKLAPDMIHVKSVGIKDVGIVNDAITFNAINSDPAVDYTEPNFIYSIKVSDPQFNQLWGMQNTGQLDSGGVAGTVGSDINVVPAWNRGVIGSRSIKVAVIDTGIDDQHPDLRNNMWTNPNEIAGNGLDDDGNGYIDDIRGWNFVSNTNNASDDHNHGTHCAGTIGAEANHLGVVGVAHQVQLIPLKFLSATGQGTLESAILAIRYATQIGVNIMSNSWGGGSYSQALLEAIQEAHAQGILFVVAAGNSASNNDVVDNFPSNYNVPNVLAVAASDSRDKLATFSSYGFRTVHVAAPGVGILSTIRGGGYGHMSGTSMATPHVAGTAVLLLSSQPNLNPMQIKDLLIRSSDSAPNLFFKVAARGRVNISNALNGIFPVKVVPNEADWVRMPYEIKSPAPYASNQTYTYSVEVAGARFIRILFDMIDTEANYDKISVLDPHGNEVTQVSGQKTAYMSNFITGSSGTVRLQTDMSQVGQGFVVRQIEYIR